MFIDLLFSRPSPSPRFAPRKKKKFSSRLTRDLSVLTVAVAAVADAGEIEGPVVVPVDVVAPEEVANPPPSSMLTTKPRSLLYLKLRSTLPSFLKIVK